MNYKLPLVTGLPTRSVVSPARLLAGLLLVVTLVATRTEAFSLIGPHADWMTPALGYRCPDDIGGPMDIDEEYRWNVPIVTYAFDPSFVDYFGSNGVAAVEEAFEVLNNLPPASSLDLTNYTAVEHINSRAAAAGLHDLKSAALPLLLEQMGLAETIRNVYVLRQWSPLFLSSSDYPGLEINATRPEWGTLGLVLQRNFDPDTLLPSAYVNGVLYTGTIYYWGPMNPAPLRAMVGIFPVDPLSWNFTIADWRSSTSAYWPLENYPGLVLTNLTPEDAGGLRYLLSSNNINLELLLPDVHGAGTNAGAYVNLAPRPGVERITFRRQEYDTLLGQAVPLTYQFTDTYLTNGVVMHQQLERVVIQPDYLFCAADTGAGNVRTPIYSRSGTTRWWNSARAIGQANSGPGVIRPPVRITFHPRASFVYSYEAAGKTETQMYDFIWGSFDVSTNAPVVYPGSTSPDSETLAMRFRLFIRESEPIQVASYTWEIPVKTGKRATLQCSTNLVDWVSCAVVTNQGSLIEWQHFYSSHPQKFFRVVPH